MSARRIAAIGMLAALAFTGSFLLMVIPNATLSIFIVFFAGCFLGYASGAFVGAISALLISLFNPYGMAPPPILLAQLFGYVLIALTGGLCQRLLRSPMTAVTFVLLAVLAVITAFEFHLPVSIIDAWLYQPFWERFAFSMIWALITVGANIVFFLLLFPVLAKAQKIAMFRLD